MQGYFPVLYQSLTEIPAREAIAGLMVGFALALAASGACTLLRKRMSDPLPAFCGLILAVSVVSMAFGVGYSQFAARRTNGTLAESGGQFRRLPPPIGRALIRDADEDGDERLTPEEAARFVKAADRDGKGWASARDIDLARREWKTPRPIHEFHPDTHRPGATRPGS